MPTVFQSWQNQNRYRAYPFCDNASLATVEDPDILLPNSFIVDFSISVPVSNADGFVSASASEISLATMMYDEPIVTLFFKNADGTKIASASIPDLSSHVPGASYPVSGLGDYDDVRGNIVIGDLEDLRKSVPGGTYNFNGALFEISTVRPVLRGVRSIRTGSRTAETSPLYGAVKLIEGSNVKLTVFPNENAIRIDAVKTAGFSSSDCDCDEVVGSSVVRYINGVSVSNLRLIGDDCVQVSQSGSTISISDKCSAPCCGCEEMDYITERLRFLETAILKIESYAETLSSIVPVSLSEAKYAVATHGELDIVEIGSGKNSKK